MGPVAPRTFLVPSTGWHAARSWKVVEVSGGTWGGAGTPATRGRLPGVSGSFLESVERSPQHPAPSVAPPPRPSPRPPSIEHRSPCTRCPRPLCPQSRPCPQASLRPPMVPPPLAGVTAAHLQHGDQGPLKHPRSPLLTRGPLRNFPPHLPPRLGMRPRGLGGGGLWARCSQAAQSQAGAASGPLPRGSTSLLLARCRLLLDSLCESHLVPLQTLGVWGCVSRSM